MKILDFGSLGNDFLTLGSSSREETKLNEVITLWSPRNAKSFTIIGRKDSKRNKSTVVKVEFFTEAGEGKTELAPLKPQESIIPKK